MTETYCVYRIVCFATGKCYVGQSHGRAKRRKWQHFSDLRNKRHFNSKLQNAFNKYGETSFYFELLEKDIPLSEIDHREVYWIEQFNSCRNGYNISEGGNQFRSTGKPCAWNGIQYSSITGASEALGIHSKTLRDRLARGYSCDNDMKVAKLGRVSPKSKSCEWNGIKYPSIKAAAKSLGIDKEVMRDRVLKGYVCDTDVPERVVYGRQCTWNGVTYPSILAAARALGVSPKCMEYRIYAGYKGDTEVQEHHQARSKRCYWNGIQYRSIAEAARLLGFDEQTIRTRLQKGYTCDGDMQRKR